MQKSSLGICASIVMWTGLAAGAEVPGLSVSPVRLDLSAAHKADAIAVVNTGPTRKLLETEALRWTQANGEDVYEPATDLRVNPSRLSIEPGSMQTVRVGLTRNAVMPSGTENAYRVYLREVPQGDEDVGSVLKFALRIGIPVFVRPAQAAKPDLVWTARHDGDGLTLTATNRGQMHARLADVRIHSLAGETAADGLRYVLPGSRRDWSIPQFMDQPLSVSVLNEAGRAQYPLEATAQ